MEKNWYMPLAGEQNILKKPIWYSFFTHILMPNCHSSTYSLTTSLCTLQRAGWSHSLLAINCFAASSDFHPLSSASLSLVVYLINSFVFYNSSTTTKLMLPWKWKDGYFIIEIVTENTEIFKEKTHFSKVMDVKCIQFNIFLRISYFW